MKRRVVVTGLGVLTSNAEGVASFADALKHGKSGVGPLTQFDTSSFSCKIAGELKSLPFEDTPSSELDRASLLALKSAEQALQDSGIDPSKLKPGQLGAAIGTTCGGVLSLEKVSEVLESGGDVDQIPSWRIEEMSFFALTNHVAKQFKLSGPVVTVTVACASGAHAVGVGTDLIRSGKAELMLVGGVDVVSRFIFRGFAALNGLGSEPYRAFDKNRGGVVLGEGAGMLMLEELEHARARGAKIYAEVLGHSSNNDGCHIVNPDPTGAGIARSFEMAMRDAGLRPEQIQHLNAHGTGTMANDSAETCGVKLAFDGAAETLPVTSIKPMIGHTSGAAGSIELIASILSLREGFLPPTIHFETKDPACDLNIVTEPRQVDLDTVISANSGFGGSNAAVIVGKPGRVPVPRAPEEQRVVITGLGALLPGVSSLDELWTRLDGPIAVGAPDRVGLEIEPFDFFARAGLAPTKDSRRMDLFSQYASMAGHLALADARTHGGELADPISLVLGSAYACLESNEKFSAGLSRVKVNPVIYQNTVSNASSGYLCMLLKLRGLVSVINQGWLGGAAAIAYAYEVVRSGRAAAVLAGGAERLCRMTGLSLERAGVLSPDHSGRPFDATSRGLLPSDGGGFVTLESLASARARGARIYGELTGYGFRNGLGMPAEEAIAQAAGEAISSLPVHARELHVYASANGVAEVDAWEWRGLERAVAAREARATVSSVKGAVGESLGAGGPLSLIAGALSLERGELAGTASAGQMPASDRLELLSARRRQQVDGVVISSVDADGSCVSLALSAMLDT